MRFNPGIACAGAVIFAAASFFFALAETALFALGKWRARQLAEESREIGDVLVGLLKTPHEFLATLVLGNTFANAGLVGIAFWAGASGAWPMPQALAASFVLILFGCEVLPKALAVRAPERWAVRLARPIQLLLSMAGPLRRVAQQLDTLVIRSVVAESLTPHAPITEEEYQELVEMAYQQGTLRESEKEIILQIVSLDQRTVAEVMKPRGQMISVPDDLPVEEMVASARQHRLRRLPLYDETPDTIVGIFNVRTFFLDPEKDLANAIEFPSFVPEAMNLLQLLKSFQRQKRGLAVVLDEFGGTAGLVTMEDILEEVVGEFRRKADEAPAFESLGDGVWRMSGAMRVEDFRREFPQLPEVEDVATMGGLMLREIGVVPQQGASVAFAGLRLIAEKADERRIRELRVEIIRKKKGA